MEAEALVEADPVNPMRLFHELSSRLPANAIAASLGQEFPSAQGGLSSQSGSTYTQGKAVASACRSVRAAAGSLARSPPFLLCFR
jgi:hypothetical protein